MELYKPFRGISLIYILFITMITNLFLGIVIYLVDSYIVVSLLQVALVIMNIYYLYYITLSVTLIYTVTDESLIISGLFGFKEVIIKFSDIEAYDIQEGNIRGVKLSGIGNDKFAFGRTIIDKIGTTHMFVTSNEKIFYLKTRGISYGVSPRDADKFDLLLKGYGLKEGKVEYKPEVNVNLYKEKAFIIPFVLVTLIILVLTLNPFILYLKHALPGVMPLHFDGRFVPTLFGSGKQFAFKQMTYGVLNMVILLCMYYASYFCAKYDRKSAYKYIYISLITSFMFLIMQLRILVVFRG